MAVLYRVIKQLAMAVLPAALFGCAARGQGQAVIVNEIRHDVGDLLTSFPPQPGQEITAVPLGRGEASSQHLVYVRGAEEPHLHEAHDLTIILLRGRGKLWVEGKIFDLEAGDIATIPAGKAHYFTNSGAAPAAALAHFSPAFEGSDRIPVPYPQDSSPAGSP